MKTKTIGVFGHVGNKNLGDEALMAAVIQNVRRRYVDAEIRGFTVNPEDTQERHGIRAFPIQRLGRPHDPKNRPLASRTGEQTGNQEPSSGAKFKAVAKKIPGLYWLLKGLQITLQAFRGFLEELVFLFQCHRNLAGTDLLIVAGSQQLSDYFGGPWGNPYNLFRWSLLSRLTGTKVVFLSVGAGPVRSSLSRFFIRRSLEMASYRSYRDDVSRKLAEEIGVKGENPVFPDLVYSLEIAQQRTAQVVSGSRLVVGINPFPYFDNRYWAEHDAAVYESYVRKLASFASWINRRGHSVVFFPTQLRADPPVIRDIRRAMNGVASTESVVASPVGTFEELLSEIAKTNIVVATRFHGVILSHLMNKPVLGIAYHEKTRDVMTRMGQGEHVLDADSFDLDSLIDHFISLESSIEEAKHEIAQRAASSREALQTQYDRVFQLIEERTR